MGVCYYTDTKLCNLYECYCLCVYVLQFLKPSLIWSFQKLMKLVVRLIAYYSSNKMKASLH